MTLPDADTEPANFQGKKDNDGKISNDNLSGWDTYRSQLCNFEIKYPLAWTTQLIAPASDREDDTAACLTLYHQLESSVGRSDSAVLFIGLTDVMSVQEYMAKEIQRLQAAEKREEIYRNAGVGGYSLSEPELTNFAGEIAILQYESGEGVNSSVITLPTRGIKIIANDVYSPEARSMLEKILSAFKLTN